MQGKLWHIMISWAFLSSDCACQTLLTEQSYVCDLGSFYGTHFLNKLPKDCNICLSLIERVVCFGNSWPRKLFHCYTKWSWGEKVCFCRLIQYWFSSKFCGNEGEVSGLTWYCLFCCCFHQLVFWLVLTFGPMDIQRVFLFNCNFGCQNKAEFLRLF